MTTTLVTCALPYANGPVHLGHMVEHIQTDVYVRALRSAGHDVVFLCADDTHGAPIEVNAIKQGLTPEAFVGKWAIEHQRDFSDFGISFDHYGSTNSDESRKYVELIYGRIKEAGSLTRKAIEQPYDAKAGRWLSDRFIRGTCPNCSTPDQYGDACEACNATYTPRELKDARSALSGAPLEWRGSEHLFFALPKHEAFLKQQLAKPGFMNAGLASQLGQFFDKGLAEWDITRDGPYFGFAIPGEPNKYFYVWLDAPIGYIAATEQWAKKSGKTALDYWAPDADCRIVHCIGKDITYFHCLFWPAVLNVAQLKLPSEVHIHGFLTVNHQKMSKSRGTFISAREFLEVLDPSYLRFYFASILGPGADDIDLSLQEFCQRVNAELVNNLGNLANRTLTLLTGPVLGGSLAAPEGSLGESMVQAALARVPDIIKALTSFDLRTALKQILEIGSSANQFLTQHQPWKVLKDDPVKARSVLSEAAEVVYLLTALLEPVVPALAEKLRAQLNRPRLTLKALASARYPLLDRAGPLGTPTPLINRLEEAKVGALFGAVQDAPVATPAKKSAPAPAPEKKAAGAATPEEIEFADFAKVSLKVGRVLACEKVPKADKLLKLSVDVGEAQPRTIVSGIAEAYAADALVGRNVVVVANLKPRALKGIESRGMLLTSGPGGAALQLLDPGQNAVPGSEVK